MRIFFLGSLFCLFVSTGDAEEKKRLKILVHSPNMGFSHLRFQGVLADLLVDAGHEVHVYIPDWEPLETRNGTLKAHRVVRFRAKHPERIEVNPHFVDPFNPTAEDKSADAIAWFMLNTKNFCEEELQDADYLRGIREEKYDVAIAEYYDLCAFYHWHYAQIPSVILTSASTYPEIVSNAWGVPLPRSYVPFMCTLQTINTPFMTWRERAINILLDFLTRKPFHDFQEAIRYLAEKHYEQPMPAFKDLLRKAKYLFVNMPEVLDHARPITHKFRAIGGIAVEKPKDRLDPEIEKIMQQSKKGVILFTLGSMLDMNRMPMERKRAVVNAMVAFRDYSLIWRISPDEDTQRLIDAQPNVHAFPWVDQVTILADPRTKAFISHCGNNGRLEAAFNGVPGIFMPLCNDQYYCTSIAIQRGIGVYLDRLQLTNETFSDALRSVLFDQRYARNAQNLKEKLLNHPVDLAEMFVKHVEYAATFESNEEMHLASIDMSFAVYHNLDIYVPLLSAVLLLFFLVYKLIRAVQRLLSRLLFPKPKRE